MSVSHFTCRGGVASKNGPFDSKGQSVGGENLNRLSISRMSLATGDDESPTLLSMVVSGPAT